MKYLLFTALLIATYPTHITYNREAYQYQELYANGGCAIDTCPDRIVDGFVPLKDLEKYSPQWWNTFCNEMLETKFECK